MNNRIILGDCLQVMETLPTASIDHIICDLPFYGVIDDDWDNQWKTEKDYLDWCRNIFIQYKRLLKPHSNIFLFTSRQYNRKICTILDELFIEKRIIIWARKRNFNNTRGRALASGYEPISFYSNGDNSIFNNIKIKPASDRKEYTTGILKDGITLSDVWSDIPALPHNHKEKVAHSTQKPLALIERIVSIGTNPGDLILDNCLGSGTTAVACKNLQRDYIGIESNADYYELALRRLL